MKKKKPGRPKIDPKLKKVRFSVTLDPKLLNIIESLVIPGHIGRNELIEAALQSKFLV